MRTTLTLEPDVAAMLEREVAATRKSMKSIVNEKLRSGFSTSSAVNRQTKHERLPTVDLGIPKIMNIDNIAEILELIEDDSH